MKRTLLRWHLGLGDALLCNGLVRVLVERGHKLLLPSYEHNLESVKAMFADLEQVRVSPVEKQLTSETMFPGWSDDIRLGYYGKDFDPLRFDESFYRQAGVPFLAKWEKFDVPGLRAFHYCPNKIQKPFIHDDVERDFRIPMDGYRPHVSDNILHHAPELIGAKEIHCINSCFAILADLINAPGKKYLHKYARPDGGALPIFGREWTILDKPL